MAALFFVAATTACNPKPPDESDYVKRITEARAFKNDQFTNASNSPVPANRRTDLLPLVYYPVDPAYNVPAALKPSSDGTTIMMPTSAGTADPFRRVGTLEFTVKGHTATLAAFAPAAARTVDRLFVPFRDTTKAEETYPAGRYLDLDRTATGVYQLDFNLAYNPDCYFNPLSICPLPPPENRLQIPIQAGEKVRK